MNKMFTQSTGPVAKQVNKQAIARIFGLKNSQVGYLSKDGPIDSYDVLFDNETQTCWYRSSATGTPVSWVVQESNLVLTTSDGFFTLLQATVVETQKLSSAEGAADVGWRRKWMRNVIKDVDKALQSQPINLWEYEDLAVTITVNGADVLDWAPALKQALLDGASNKRKVYAPGGTYYFSKMDAFTNLDPTGSTTGMSTYVLVGDGHDQTIFTTSSTEGKEMLFHTCRVFLDNFSLQRVLTNEQKTLYMDTGMPILELGLSTKISAVRLSYIGNIRINGSPWGLNIEHIWDSIIFAPIVHNFNTIGIRVGIHAIDNSNNLLIVRPQIESCKYTGSNLCRGLAIMSGPGGTRRNHNITIIQPHIEAVNLRCQLLHLSYGLNVRVINPAFNRNNGSVDEGLYLDPSLAAPAVYSSDGVNIHIDGGVIQHIGARDDSVAPIMKFVGVHKAFKCTSYIDTGKASSRTSLEAGLDIALSTNGMRELSFAGASLNSFNTMSSIGDRLRVGPTNDLQKVFDLVGESFIPAGATATLGRINFMYSNTQDQATAQSSVGYLTSEGHLGIKALRGQQVTVAAGASVIVNVGQGAFERRGVYLVTTLSNDNQLMAMFYNIPGQTPNDIKTGTNVNLSRAAPDATVVNKLCIYQSAQYIVLENRTGADITACVNFFA